MKNLRALLQGASGFALAFAAALIPTLVLFVPAGPNVWAWLFVGFASGLIFLLTWANAFLNLYSVLLVLMLFGWYIWLGKRPQAIGAAIFALLGIGFPAIARFPDLYRAYALNQTVVDETYSQIPALKSVTERHDLVLLDGINTRGEQNYDIEDTLTVITGMRVIRVQRLGLDHHFDEAWETKLVRLSECANSRTENSFVELSPRGSQRQLKPLRVDVCLRRLKIKNPLNDLAPAVIFRHPWCADANTCEYYDAQIVERTESGETELGVAKYNFSEKRVYPRVATPAGVPTDNWLNILLSAVLRQDISDMELMKHVVAER